MLKIISTKCIKNKKVLYRIKEERKIVHAVTNRRANWIGHMLHRNCFLKHVTEGKTEGKLEGTGRREGRSRQLLEEDS
jgi:hypothetical protein